MANKYVKRYLVKDFVEFYSLFSCTTDLIRIMRRYICLVVEHLEDVIDHSLIGFLIQFPL